MEPSKSVGRSGGVVVFWSSEDSVGISSYSRNFIYIIVERADHVRWRITGFYDFPESSRQSASWGLLRALAQRVSLHWVCIGDFNNLLCINDKWGGVEYPVQWLNGFHKCIEDSCLTEIPLIGLGFTWERGRGIDSFVMDLFPCFKLHNLVSNTSNHNPTLLVWKTSFPARRVRCFKFDSSWLSEEGFNIVILDFWSH
ncbi:putative Transposon TX1 [Gossypium australe]|uniref:Putative Transposon TX1 n=1 Tax=Gossypium australe TaxID=47621 RepID=A0A5B6VJ28_9ROSI|nr:putative Transposon TX1 [Gossypium australe]